MRPQYRSISAVAISDPIVVDHQQGEFKVGLAVALKDTPALTYSVQFTMDDPTADYSTDYNTDATWFDVTDMAALTANAVGNIFFPVRAVRLNVTAHTTGTAELTLLQATDN